MAIPVFVVNTQKFRYFGVATFIACFKHSSAFKVFSHSAVHCLPSFLAFFSNTFLAAINSFVRRRPAKRLRAMSAFIFNRSLQILGFIVTLPRTIFSFLNSAANVRKNFPASSTVGFDNLTFCKSLATERTVFTGLFSIVSYSVI